MRDWFAYYYHHIAWKTHNRFNVNGHLLIVALYFILLFSFPILMDTQNRLSETAGYFPVSAVFSSVRQCNQLCAAVPDVWLVYHRRGAYGVDDAVSAGVCRAVGLAVQSGFYRRAFPPAGALLVHGERPVEDILGKFAGRKDKYHVAKCMNIKEGTMR